MLGGSIGIRSEVGQGTEVTIRIPLMRVLGSDSAASTPSVTGSTEGSRDDAIMALQAEYSGKSIAIFGMTDETKIGEVLEQYVTKWFSLDIASTWSTSLSADIILVDEKQFPSLLESNFIAASIIVLCSNSNRYHRKTSQMSRALAVEFVSKPYGPYKLAKALRLCLDKAKDTNSQLIPTISVPESPIISEAGTVVPGLEALTLEPDNLYAQTCKGTNGTVAASESANARMAVNTLSTTPDTERPANAGEEFPFPTQETETHDVTTHNTHSPYQDDFTRWKAKPPKLKYRATEPLRPTSLFSIPPSPFRMLATTQESIPAETLDSTAAQLSKLSVAVQPQEKRPPRLLLVDDNNINLRLLQTFMRKRKYKLVDSALNGQLAVEAAEHHPEGYDIIFMGKLRYFGVSPSALHRSHSNSVYLERY